MGQPRGGYRPRRVVDVYEANARRQDSDRKHRRYSKLVANRMRNAVVEAQLVPLPDGPDFDIEVIDDI